MSRPRPSADLAKQEHAERVLVVEDDDDTRRILVDVLRDDGYDVVAALDGRHALRLAAAADPDTIVTDVNLPEMKGDEFMRRWREAAHRRNEDPSFILVSGDPDARRIGSRIKASAVLRKPIDMWALLSAVRSAVASGRSGHR